MNLEQHYKDNRDRYVAIARKRLSKNHAVAEEAVQETYERVIRYFDSFDEKKASFDTWVNGILTNVIKDLKEIELHQGAVDIPINDVEDIKPSREFLYIPYEVLNKEISKRKKGAQNILHLFCMCHYSAKDISYIVPESYSNVRKIISRFRLDMKEKFNV